MLALVVTLALQAATPAASPPPPPAAERSAPVAEVTVTGQRPAPAARASWPSLAQRAEQVQAESSVAADEQMGRWYDRYCPGVGGLANAQAAQLAQAMTAAAVTVGVKAGAADCRPNVLVLISPDPNVTLKRLLARNDGFFGDERAAVIRRALGGDAPVRWYVAAQTRAHDGMPVGPGTFRNRSSHITMSDRFDFMAVIVLADSRRIGSTPLATLADYFAMATLAQVKPPVGAHPATVLDLFEGAPPAVVVQGLTTWDRSFLKGLYALDPATNAHAQRFGIARDMAQPPPATAEIKP